MAWEWSHTDEAYSTAYENLHKKSRKFLLEAYCEFAAFSSDEDGDDEYDDSKYLDAKEEANRLGFTEETLADSVWQFASELATCDNGGFNAWVCPYGCHTVSFDEEED